MVNTRMNSFADLVAMIEGTAEDTTEVVDTEASTTKIAITRVPRCTIKRKKVDGILQTIVTSDDAEVERKTVLRLLNESGWTLTDITSIWRHSRKDTEAIEILSDLTSFCERNIRTLLNLKDVPPALEEGIASYWANC